MLPYATATDMELQRDPQGNWAVPGGAIGGAVKVDSATMNQDVTVSKQDKNINIPVTVEYATQSSQTLKNIPINIYINDDTKPILRGGNPDKGHFYIASSLGITKMEFVKTNDGEALAITTGNTGLPLEVYNIKLEIPETYMASGQKLQLTTKLNVVDGSVKPDPPKPDPPKPDKIDLNTAQVTVNDTSITYDGTAHKPSVTVTAKDKTLHLGTDYTVSYENNVDVGQATINIEAVQGSDYIGSTTAQFDIEKASISANTEKMTVTNNHAASYTFDMTQLLPDLEDGKVYGDTQFTLGRVDLGDYYVDGSASISKNMLTLPINDVNNNEEKEIGTITIEIVTDNYTVSDGTITVQTSNKEIPKGTPDLSKNTLTYGEQLSEITLSGDMKDSAGNIVDGEFAWNEPTKEYVAGTHHAEWTFTPQDNSQYQTATGKSEIVVEKVRPTGKPQYTEITSTGKTLSDANINTDNNAFSVTGSVAWDLPDNTIVQPNIAYDWTFTPTDTSNYETLTDSITLYIFNGDIDENKEILQGTPNLSKNTLTYGEQLSEIKLSGNMQDKDGNSVVGEFTWNEPTKEYVVGTHDAEWTFTPEDGNQYQKASGQSKIVVNKLTPTGNPQYTAIKTSGKTLADTNITIENASFSVSGSVKWDLPESTVVQKNTAYNWTFTPADTQNCNILTGSITPYVVSGGSGGSGGGSSSSSSSSSSANKTETIKNPDGSTTTTESKKDGTVIETNKMPNGIIGTVVTDKHDNIVEMSSQISDEAVQQSQEKGEPVKIPVKVPVATSTENAPIVKVDVPQSSNGGVNVEIPVKNLTAGTVAVIVKPDGTEQVVKKSILLEQSVALNLDGNTTLKIVDNSKTFQDVAPSAWYKDAVDFMSARELMKGSSNEKFTPNANLSRSMLAMILYNLENNPDTIHNANFRDVQSGSWYADAVQWATKEGIMFGYGNGTVGPNDSITREQLVVMLYRYEGSPETHSDLSGITDNDKISTFAQPAMAWALENGILHGNGNGKLNPSGKATRAEVAQILKNYMND